MNFVSAIAYYGEHEPILRKALDELIERSRPETADEPAYTFAILVEGFNRSPNATAFLAALAIMRLAEGTPEQPSNEEIAAFEVRQKALDRLLPPIVAPGGEMQPPPCADHQSNELGCPVCSAQRRAFYTALGREVPPNAGSAS